MIDLHFKGKVKTVHRFKGLDYNVILYNFEKSNVLLCFVEQHFNGNGRL